MLFEKQIADLILTLFFFRKGTYNSQLFGRKLLFTFFFSYDLDKY